MNISFIIFMLQDPGQCVPVVNRGGLRCRSKVLCKGIVNTRAPSKHRK